MKDILMALWFFLPAGLANTTPVFTNKLPFYNQWNTPMDMGYKLGGQRLLGDNKRWRGLVGGIIIGAIAMILQHYAYNHSQAIRNISYLDYQSGWLWLEGALIGAGALLGDAVESFFKRLRKVPAGHSWFPFDQIDYIVGGLFTSLLFVRLPISAYLLIFVIWFGLHLIASYVGYLLKLKDRPI